MNLKYELQNYLEGDERNGQENSLRAIRDYLRSSSQASARTQTNEFYKEIEEEILSDYADRHNLWFEDLDKNTFLDAGAEQRVYLFSEDYVIKLNKGIFYDSWADYFESILLHNFFFDTTYYDFLGFLKERGKLFSVVKQPYIKKTAHTNLESVKIILENNGFLNDKNNDYYNQDLGVILEDLHDENVLTNSGVLFFIDTVFYLKKLNTNH